MTRPAFWAPLLAVGDGSTLYGKKRMPWVVHGGIISPENVSVCRNCEGALRHLASIRQFHPVLSTLSAHTTTEMLSTDSLDLASVDVGESAYVGAFDCAYCDPETPLICVTWRAGSEGFAATFSAADPDDPDAAYPLLIAQEPIEGDLGPISGAAIAAALKAGPDGDPVMRTNEFVAALRATAHAVFSAAGFGVVADYVSLSDATAIVRSGALVADLAIALTDPPKAHHDY